MIKKEGQQNAFLLMKRSAHQVYECLTVTKANFRYERRVTSFFVYHPLFLRVLFMWSGVCVYTCKRSFWTSLFFRLCFHYNRHCRVSHLFLSDLFRSVGMHAVRTVYLQGENMNQFSLCFAPLAVLSFLFLVVLFLLCKRKHKNHIALLWFLVFIFCALSLTPILSLLWLGRGLLILEQCYNNCTFDAFFGLLMRSIVGRSTTN